jgi:hydroxyacylglutathione hydrolase
MIPIEDFNEDIVGKAMRGLQITTSQLSESTGVTEPAITAILNGSSNDESTLRTIAPALHLHVESLVNATWQPNPIEVTGLATFNTRWHDMRVNAFVVFDPASKAAAIFDTGADCTPILDFIKTEQLQVVAIFITHTHTDHVADIHRLQSMTGHPPTFVNSLEFRLLDASANAMNEGGTFEIGSLRLRTLLTNGHAIGGNTYVIEGLERPLAIVGDSLFARSMGGGKVSYADALKNNREKVLTLSEDTVICPGHGPLTTVAEERLNNPFFPEFK